MPQDRRKALEYFHQAAAEQDISAMFWLGHVYKEGDESIGLAPDPIEATRYLELAAAQGHTGSQLYLSQLYRTGDEGLGLPKNLKRMWYFLQQAVEAKDPEALFELGGFHLQGEYGVPVNARKALSCFLEAAAQVTLATPPKFLRIILILPPPFHVH